MRTVMIVAIAACTAIAGSAAASELKELSAAELDRVTAGIALLLPAVQKAPDAAKDSAGAAPVLEPREGFLLLNAGPERDLSPPGLPRLGE